ncbi:MAG: beta-N-acetylhexosaminidase [Rhodospirillaceae bacterium]|nr:beta-N-acetylhexosaminidase [Rhodospirillaceae bacterium]
MSESVAAPPAAAIFGLGGLALTDVERDFFRRVRPAGFILFARNVDTPAQVRALVDALRALNPDIDPLVLIDQEGGRVQRLRPPHWRFAPAAAEFGALHACDPHAAANAVRLNMALIGRELLDLGIDVDCAPVLDVPVAGAHDVIGDRAYGRDPHTVTALGRAAADGLIDAGVMPVIKHIPGHGRAAADSHLALPVVDTDLETLRATDFRAFADFLRPPGAPVCFGMTAHVIYRAIDAERPATLSPVVIGDVIRGELGFDGLLMSDDLSMKALSGPFDARAAQSLAAGCDVVLHCNGDMTEMEAVAMGTGPLGPRGLGALVAAQAIRRGPRAPIASVPAAEVMVINRLRAVA